MSNYNLTEKQRIIHDGMINMGFKPFLENSNQSQLNITFINPEDEFYDFNIFFDELRSYGFIICPQINNNREGFKLENIENLSINDIDKLLDSVMKSMYWEWIAI